MTPKTAALLADPHPRSHIVFPYTEESLIAEAVSLYSSGGLSRDEAVVLVTTPEHRTAIEHRLQQDGFDVNQLTVDGRLVLIDAQELLGGFLIDGAPDAARFHQLVGAVIVKARQNSPSGKVRLFGEMVSLLYGDNLAAASELEELWNGAIDTYGVPLLCTYALDGPEPESRSAFPEKLLAQHSHHLPI